jgi:hypothetical protein
MTADEMAQCKQRCRDRWGRVLAELGAWKLGGPTWKPVLTEQQKKEHERYVKENNLPF